MRGTRVLNDSARSLQSAIARAEARLAKRHNRGETVRIYHNGKLVLANWCDRLQSDCPTAEEEIGQTKLSTIE